MRILNLYAGIGGNRKLWGDEHEVTAVEIEPKIAEIYMKNFPKDKVIIMDAHLFLLTYYKSFDFIWSSPPCQTHSVTNHFLNAQGVVRYPDMALWQEIIFLKHFFKGKWVVENVKSYYEPLIKPQEAGRHYFWSNFHISNKKIELDIGRMNGPNQKRIHTKRKIEGAFNLSNIDIKNKEGILNNCVKPELGLHIFNCAFKIKQERLI